MYRDLISVLMTTSPIPSHPSTEIVDKVIEAIQFHLGDVQIWLLCDGVRTPEHENRRANYEAYKAAMHQRPYRPSLTFAAWNDSVQQAQMIRAVLPKIRTPLVLYNEHDYALTRDPIDWEGIINALEQDKTNCVRFHNLEEIHPLHQHLMMDCFEGANGEHGGRMICDPPMVCGVPMIRTVQYWGCPHLMKTRWYIHQMFDPAKFSERSYTEIEPALYGHICDSPWENFKLMVYAPRVPSMRRSVHLGGRGHDKDDPKRDFIFR